MAASSPLKDAPSSYASSANTTKPEHASDVRALFQKSSFATQYKSADVVMIGYAQKLLEMIRFSSHPGDRRLCFLDLACGGGICTRVALDILRQQAQLRSVETSFTAADFSTSMLDVLRESIGALAEVSDWPQVFTAAGANVSNSIQLQQVDMMNASSLPSDHFTHLTCNYGPAVCADPRAALSEMYRVLAPGGVAGMTYWMHLGWRVPFIEHLNLIRTEARSRIDSETAQAGDEVIQSMPPLAVDSRCTDIIAGFTKSKEGEAWDNPDFIVAETKKAGFADVKAERKSVTTSHRRQDVVNMIDISMLALYAGTLWDAELVDQLKRTDINQRLQARFDADFDRLRDQGKEERLYWDQWEGLCVTGGKA